MTSTPQHPTPRPPVRGIIPPHILRALAEHGEERAARAAEASLTVGRRMVATREVRAARTGRPGLPHPTAGVIPPSLQQRATAQRETGPAGALQAATGAGPQRSVHDAQGGTELPGVQMRSEGEPPSGDESADEAYDGLGHTWSLFAEQFGWDSVDGRGAPLVATVHFDQNFDNAYWDGQQLVFGDGDGVYFSSFTDAVEVIGHELTHGVVQYTAGFTYVGQSGALNESVCDCFGAMVEQRVRSQSAAEADWLIGESIFTDAVQGVALRSMKAPGTAYDDPVLGTDPQPASMADYVELPHDEENDNGGVHINSGIPNRAFYLAATAIGGTSWEGAGPIWFHTLTQGGLPKDADFAAFAAATEASATTLHGADSAQRSAVAAAWREVGVATAGLTAP